MKTVIRKDWEWVEENDKELAEIFSPRRFYFLDYKIVGGELRYLPNGEEPHPIRADKLEDLTDSYLDKIGLITLVSYRKEKMNELLDKMENAFGLLEEQGLTQEKEPMKSLVEVYKELDNF